MFVNITKWRPFKLCAGILSNTQKIQKRPNSNNLVHKEKVISVAAIKAVPSKITQKIVGRNWILWQISQNGDASEHNPSQCFHPLDVEDGPGENDTLNKIL